MKNLLALDSSSNACSAALLCNGSVTHRWELAPRGHMQRLLPMADELLQAAGLAVNQLDAIAFGRGPGSFTGLRVATGIVQGLAWGADLPVIPVSTLRAIAAGFQRTQPDVDGRLLVAVDARMGELYAAHFRLEGQRLVNDGAEQLVPLADAAALLENVDAGAGSGWQLAPLNQQRPAVCLPELEPDALDILHLARQADAVPVQAHEAKPVYLRDSVNWQKRTRIRTESL
ncbi:tRNA (adenosine(37)-N6)-threonylcarbamoyltransferase complex dimerization subunit type 1 TsaB [Simiduia agarivorans]|uniref:tRNA threonylcarbamoyladenosine biosynthesis protein TsaB n=1 Tax=Simiduia agarivorans (strain DSM 21679 / JCM 13881 / BCRC 17597 / SA1) TaxID=1117647 RepID=K4KH03_SIMAS|nr:tRNA (adenosine(37)-N6)-threonylcarbamoyltransferase complex dimerization subunit type 1 TsaB [Simiduia agarivorans]AFU97490.1 glycoprotease family protein [Simiduia agarivorans SA1 = DSM 21679]